MFIKVNASVDRGAAEIVSALSLFERLETIESCEGTAEAGPWVCFHYGKYWDQPWRELAEFLLGWLSPRLVELIGDDAVLTIRVTPSAKILGEISVRFGATQRVAAALRALANAYPLTATDAEPILGGSL